MKLIRCCAKVRLPGTEGKWRRMAKLAGFDRTVKVRGFRTSDIHNKRLYVGTMNMTASVITVRIEHTCGTAVFPYYKPRGYNPLSTFGHELGHFILKQRGRSEWTTRAKAWRDNAEQRHDPVERACDRYSRLLRGNT
jgi:hypothetical protein